MPLGDFLPCEKRVVFGLEETLSSNFRKKAKDRFLSETVLLVRVARLELEKASFDRLCNVFIGVILSLQGPLQTKNGSVGC